MAVALGDDRVELGYETLEPERVGLILGTDRLELNGRRAVSEAETPELESVRDGPVLEPENAVVAIVDKLLDCKRVGYEDEALLKRERVALGDDRLALLPERTILLPSILELVSDTPVL